MDINIRNREDVEFTLQYAKLDATDMRPVAQCLFMAPNLDNESIKLFEMDNNMLDSLLSGQCLTIRGSKTDKAVLCTSGETFEIKGAETSNSLLILPECSFSADLLENMTVPSAVSRQICALKHDYYELRRIKPRLKHLKECLEENMFNGNASESEQSGHKYSFEELLDIVQASENELRQGLVTLKACEINGCWRLLDFDYLSSVVTSILAAKDEFAWSFDAIPSVQLLNVLQNMYPREVVKHVLEVFSNPGQPCYDTPDGMVYRLCERSVCRFFAEMMLHTAHTYHLREFEEAWQLAVPEEMKTNLSYLEGLAIVDRTAKPEIISYLPVQELPEDTDERFQLLFKAKEKWTLEEITPYIEGICVDGRAGVGVLLTKYARVSTQKGAKLYSSRK